MKIGELNMKTNKVITVICATALMIMQSVEAQSIYTRQNSTDLLNTSAAWGGTSPTGSDIAKWDVTCGSNIGTGLGGNVTWGQIQIANNVSGAVTIAATTSSTIILNGVSSTGIDMSVANQSLTINNPVTLGGAQTWTVASGITLTVGNYTVDNGGNLLTVDGAGTISLSGNYMGNGGITKNGTGRLVLSAATTYKGATRVNLGILDFASASLNSMGGGNGSRDITVVAGAAVRRATLDNTFLNRLVETNAEITVMTGDTVNNFDFSSSTGANLPNAFLGNWASTGGKCEYKGVLTPASDNYRLGGTGSRGLLGIVNTNMLTGTQGLLVGGTAGSGFRVELAAAQNFTGDTVINTSAKLTLGNNLALQNSPLNLGGTGGTFACSDGAISQRISGDVATPSPTFGGLKGSRDLLSAFTASGGNNESLLAATSIAGFTLNPGAGVTCTYSGVIANFTNGTTITKTGAGTQILSGTCTYTGSTTISAGTLGLGANNILTNSPIILTGGTLDAGAYTNSLKTLTLSGTAAINLGAGGKLVFADSSALSWSGTLNVTGAFVTGQSLRFGTTSNGLTPEQLAKIKVVGGGATALDANGFLKTTKGMVILFR
jgi:fibronectin-binding autotransporter adhesin